MPKPVAITPNDALFLGRVQPKLPNMFVCIPFFHVPLGKITILWSIFDSSSHPMACPTRSPQRPPAVMSITHQFLTYDHEASPPPPEQWKKRAPWLFRVGDNKLPSTSYVGIIINHSKDPCWTNRIHWKVRGCVSWLTWRRLSLVSKRSPAGDNWFGSGMNNDEYGKSLLLWLSLLLQVKATIAIIEKESPDHNDVSWK